MYKESAIILIASQALNNLIVAFCAALLILIMNFKYIFWFYIVFLHKPGLSFIAICPSSGDLSIGLIE